MLIEKSRLRLAWENEEPARTGRRAKLGEARAAYKWGPTPDGGFQWPVYPNPITMRTMHAYEAWERERKLA